MSQQCCHTRNITSHQFCRTTFVTRMTPYRCSYYTQDVILMMSHQWSELSYTITKMPFDRFNVETFIRQNETEQNDARQNDTQQNYNLKISTQ